MAGLAWHGWVDRAWPGMARHGRAWLDVGGHNTQSTVVGTYAFLEKKLAQLLTLRVFIEENHRERACSHQLISCQDGSMLKKYSYYLVSGARGTLAVKRIAPSDQLLVSDIGTVAWP